METVINFCRKHGETEHYVTKNGKLKCKKCAVEYDYNKRHRIKQILVDYKGGKCEICGYDKCLNALDFHHINKEEKNFALNSSNYNKSIELLKKEVDKCILVCANCHREIHYQENEQRRKEILENLPCNTNDRKYAISKLNLSEIKKDIENRLYQSEIAKKYNVSLATLKRFLSENNINMRNVKIDTPSEKILEYYEQCLSYTKLSKLLGCTTKVIKKYCIDNNLIEKINEIRKKHGLKEVKNKNDWK